MERVALLFKPAPRIPAGLLVIAIAVTVGAAALAWTVLESRQAVRREVLMGHAQESRLAAEAVAAELDGGLSLLQGLSRRRLLIQSAVEGNWAGTEYHLQDLLSVNPRFGSAFILDTSGRVQLRKPADPGRLGEDFSQHRLFTEAAGGSGYVSDLLNRGEDRPPEVALAAPMRTEGRLVGVLLVTIPIDRFDFAADLMAPRGGSIVVTDRQGRPVATIGRLMTGQSLAQSRVVKEALQGESGAEEGLLPGRAGSRLIGFAPVEELGWAVIAESPSRVALAQVSDLTWRLAGVLGLTLLGGMAAGISTIRLVRRLDRLRRESSAIVTSMGDAILVTDSNWRVMWGNPALEALSGWRAEEARDRLAHDVYRTFDERGEQVDLASAMTDGPSAVKGNLTLESRDGNRIPIQTTTAPILDEKGARLGYVVVGRDVSRERELDALKSTLVSTVSHELRTPLTMIQGFSELLLNRELDEERSSKAVTEIHTSAERLSRLIDDLLSVSRIESGRMELDIFAIDLRPVVEDVIRPFSAREGFRFQIDVEELEVRADRDRLMQILTNLVSNAVKYSEPNSPIIITAQGSGASAEVAVIDRGIGMSQAEIASAFEMFSRVDRPEVRDVGGTGLGLYITRSLVEAHGGQIWIENQPGGGTGFAFTLPLANSGAETSKMARKAPAEKGSE